MRAFDTKIDNTAPQPSGRLPAAQFNSVSSELDSAVSTAGLTLDSSGGPDTNLLMLAEAQARYASGGIWVQDSGAANAYVLGAVGAFKIPSAPFKFQWLNWHPGNTVTGASVLNYNGTGALPIVTHALTPLVGGELVAGKSTACFFNPAVGGAGSWVVPQWANSLSYSTSTFSGTALSGEGINVDGTSHVNLNFGGLVSDTPIDTDVFAFLKLLTGHHKLITLAGLRTLLSGPPTTPSVMTISGYYSALISQAAGYTPTTPKYNVLTGGAYPVRSPAAGTVLYDGIPAGQFNDFNTADWRVILNNGDPLGSSRNVEFPARKNIAFATVRSVTLSAMTITSVTSPGNGVALFDVTFLTALADTNYDMASSFYSGLPVDDFSAVAIIGTVSNKTINGCRITFGQTNSNIANNNFSGGFISLRLFR